MQITSVEVTPVGHGFIVTAYIAEHKKPELGVISISTNVNTMSQAQAMMKGLLNSRVRQAQPA